MGKYNFDELVERRGSGSFKWNVGADELPMWVADMDFKTAPEIIEAIRRKAAHGVYGYAVLPGEWRGAIAGWWKKRHGLQLEEDWLLFCTGVVMAISSIVRKLTTVGENVLVQTPVYNMFFRSIEDNGRHVLENKLIYDGQDYHMDFEDLERKLSDPQTSLMILCNPHNPVGKIWDRETLERVGELCYKHHVLVLSDEIHCDITAPGREYIPFASVSDICRRNSITCVSPTKTFNLAGIQTSAVIVPDEVLRHKVSAGLRTDGVSEPNLFAAEAAVAAFTHGAEWLDELREYLWENRRTAEEYIAREIPQIKAVPGDATYLMWLDGTSLLDSLGKGLDGGETEKTNKQNEKVVLADIIRSNSGLFLNAGEPYRNAEGFLRMNLACPKSRVMEGLKRLKKGVESIKTVACMLLVCLLVGLSGCAGADGNEADAQEESPLPPEPTGILEPVAVFKGIDQGIVEKENEFLYAYGQDWCWIGDHFYYTETEYGTIEDPKPPKSTLICAAPDGSSNEILSEWDGWEIFRLFEGAEGQIYAFAEYVPVVGAGFTVYLLQLDLQGQEINRFLLEEQALCTMPRISCDAGAVDAEGRIAMLGRYVVSGTDDHAYILHLLKADSGYIGSMELDLDYPQLLDLGERGIYLCENAGGSLYLYQVDFDAVRLKEMGRLPADRFALNEYSAYRIIADPEKGILVSEAHALYQYDPVTGESSKILDWDAPEVNVEGNLIKNIRFGDVVGTAEDGSPCQNLMAVWNAEAWGNFVPELVCVEYVDRAYLPKRQTIVLGSGFQERRVEDAARRFNRSNTQYHVALREYDMETMLDELLRDKKNVPDLLDLRVVDAAVLAGKGLLEDLEPYFDASAVVGKEDILPVIWESGILNGKMRDCTTSFALWTLWCSDPEVVHGGWGAEELAELAKRHPATPLVSFKWGASRPVVNWLAGYGSEQFLDIEKGVCSFDSPEFIALLEQLKEPNALPELTDQPANYEASFLNQEYLFREGYYFGPQEFMQDWTSLNGKAVIVGYPFSGEDSHLISNGQRFGISSLSECKDGAWAFLEFLLSKENQLWYEREFGGFPVRSDTLEIYLTQPYSPDKRYRSLDLKSPKTKAGMEAFREVLAHLRPESRLYDSEIRKILSEEIPYCLEGDKSAEEVASTIQSRVQIYLKEMK